MSVRPPFLRGMTGCVSEVLRHEPGGPRKWTRTPSGRCQRESDRLDRREGEAREYARRPGAPEPNDEGPFPDGRVRGDVRHLVDPEDPRHEEAQGYREDDGG